MDVIATQPTEADRGALAHISANANAPVQEATFIVKIALQEMPPATSRGRALYANDERIPKYWAYPGDFYFKDFDPNFLAEPEALRYSLSTALSSSTPAKS